MLFFEGGYCGLDLLKASLRLERFDELPDLVACAAPQCHSALFLIVIGDLNAQMAAAGMNDDINIARIGTIRLDKMVAAAQRADAFFRPLQIDVRRAAKRAQVDGRAVFVGGPAHFPSAGDRAADQRIQLFRIDLPLCDPDGFHAAADIHTHHTGNHLIRNGHGRPDGTAFSRVNVRHDADFAVPKRFFVADQADLLLCFSVQHRRIAQRGIEFSLYFDHNGDPLSDGAGTCGFHRSGSGYQEAVPGCIRPIS